MNELKLAKTFAYILASVIILSICSIPLGILTFNSNDKLTAEMVSILKIDDELNNVNWQIELGAGKFTFDHILATQKIMIEAGVGSLDIVNSDLNNLTLDGGVGKIDFSGYITGNSKIEVGIGKIGLDIKDTKENYALILEKGIGSIEVDGVDSSSGTFGNGKNTLNASGGIGKLEINFSK